MEMRCFLLLIVATLLAAFSAHGDASGRIIGGKVANPGDFPWQALVLYRLPGWWSFCGGTLISDRWVVTAAHCTRDATDFSVRLGAIERVEQEEGTVEIKASRVIVHPDYDNFLINDIALIETESPVVFTDRIRPAKLPNKGEVVAPNVNVTVSGWGLTEHGGQVADQLHYVSLRTITNQECIDEYGPKDITDATLCAKGHPYNGTCNGDSGGPLVTLVGDQATHVGIVSFANVNGCASGLASGYVRIESYLDWILENTGITI